jgi:phosphatidylinositol alpha-1,6-mannosyltransferase
MKILIPTIDYPPIEGGISTVALQVSRELAAMGHEVTVVAPAYGESGQHFEEGVDFDAAEPVTVIRFEGYGLGWFRFFPLLLKTWPRLRQTDLILGINIAYGGIIGRMARFFFGKRYLTFAYAYEFLKFKNNFLAGLLLRSCYYRSEKTISISSYTADSLVRFGVRRPRIATILPGAPAVETASDAETHRVRHELDLGEARFVLAVGRFVPRKGHMTLVQAWPQVLESCPNTHLVLVGRGPMRDDCEAHAKGLGIEAFVSFPGYVDDASLAALYSDCSCFALPTGKDQNGQVEGFGLVFAEASAYGKPVVGGYSGGVVDAIREGETGLLVNPESATSLARAVVRILSSPTLATEMGEKGRLRVEEELNWHCFTKSMLESLGAVE